MVSVLFEVVGAAKDFNIAPEQVPANKETHCSDHNLKAQKLQRSLNTSMVSSRTASQLAAKVIGRAAMSVILQDAHKQSYLGNATQEKKRKQRLLSIKVSADTAVLYTQQDNNRVMGLRQI